MPPQLASLSPVSSPAARAFKTAVSLSLVMTILAAVSYPFLQPVIPVFYTLAQPEKQLVGKLWIFVFPLLAWVITILHFSLLKSLKTIEGSLERIFCWTTIGVIALTGLLLVRVILIVT